MKKKTKKAKKLLAPETPNMKSALNQCSTIKEAQVDTQRLAEFHYRRGLVSAMECILRELR